MILLGALLGVLTWSLAEYGIHRFLGHHPALRGRNLFGYEHTAHHARGGYFGPTHLKVLAAAVVLGLTGPPAVALFGAAGAAWAVGFIGFYAVYEWLHRQEHVRPGAGPYGRWARKHHFHHHFHNPRANHGVTSPVWDLVFGTYERPGTIVVPRRLAMPWVVDPQTGQVPPELAGEYALR